MDSLINLNWSQLLYQSTPFLLLVVTGFAVLLADIFSTRDKDEPNAVSLSVIIAFVGVLLAKWLILPRWLATENSPVGELALWQFDRVSLFTMGLVLGITLLTILFSPSYLRDRRLPRGEFFGLVILGVAGMWAMVATHHLIMVFIGIETLSLAAYVLAAFHRSEERSLEAGMKYFVLGSLAAAFLLFGLAFIYGGSGTLDLLELRSMSFEMLDQSHRIFSYLGIVFLMVGLAFKIAAAPFQWWAPDVYTGAPLPVTAFFATAVKVGAFAVLWRIADALVGFTGEIWTNVMWWVAVMTMTVGNLAALAQDDVKRMLAYSSVAHAGYTLIAIAVVPTNDPMVVSSLLFYLVAYSLMTVGAFTVLIALCKPDSERTSLHNLAGLAGRHPALAGMLALFLLSLAGLPPTIGFFGKYYIFQTAIGAGETLLVIVAVLNSVLSVAYYVRPIVVMYFRPEPQDSSMLATSSGLTIGIRVVLVLTGFGVLAYGIFPTVLLKWLVKLQ